MRKKPSSEKLSPDVGWHSARDGLPIIACFFVFFLCRLSTHLWVRFLGVAFLSTLFALANRLTWKVGWLKTNLRLAAKDGLITRSQHPEAFRIVSILGLLGEMLLITLSIIDATKAPQW